MTLRISHRNDSSILDLTGFKNSTAQIYYRNDNATPTARISHRNDSAELHPDRSDISLQR